MLSTAGRDWCSRDSRQRQERGYNLFTTFIKNDILKQTILVFNMTAQVYLSSL
jgi:hypothetical protein